MLTIYGNDVSIPSNKVRYVANALGLNYEYQQVNLLNGENQSETHLKLHPAGKIPVIVDDDFVLFESNAIIKYLADKAGSNLYPKELRRRALVDQWADFASLHIGTAMGRVFFNRVIYKLAKMELDERSLKDGLSFLERFLPVVDGQLKKNKFLAGPESTLADFVLLAHLDPAEVSGIDLNAYSQLKSWREGLQAKEFYQRCFPSYAKMLQGLAAKTGK